MQYIARAKGDQEPQIKEYQYTSLTIRSPRGSHF